MSAEERAYQTNTYLCQICDSKFVPRFVKNTDKLICPRCGATDEENLVPIYMEDSPEEEQMRTNIDWHEGD